MYLYTTEGQCLAPPRSASLKEKVQGRKHDDDIQYLTSILQNREIFLKLNISDFKALKAVHCRGPGLNPVQSM
jgi:hypothetical protein